MKPEELTLGNIMLKLFGFPDYFLGGSQELEDLGGDCLCDLVTWLDLVSSQPISAGCEFPQMVVIVREASPKMLKKFRFWNFGFICPDEHTPVKRS